MIKALGDSYPVTVYNPAKAYNGFTLFTPTAAMPSVTWLIDMHGRIVHRWNLPGWVRMQAILLPTGNIFFGLDLPKPAMPDIPFSGGQLAEMDWDGNIVWSYVEPYLEAHDWIRLKNGNTLLQKYVKIPNEIATKVQGGVPGTERDGVMYSTSLYEITPEGKSVWKWVTYEHLDPMADSLSFLCPRFLWPDWNSLVELPDGNIMACSPHTSNIVIIDKPTGVIKWRWGKGVISFPHNPTMLDNGNILVLNCINLR